MKADEKTRSDFFDGLEVGDNFDLGESRYEVVKLFQALSNPDVVRARRHRDDELILIGWEDYVFNRAV